jgi:hypothetical protein
MSDSSWSQRGVDGRVKPGHDDEGPRRSCKKAWPTGIATSAKKSGSYSGSCWSAEFETRGAPAVALKASWPGNASPARGRGKGEGRSKGSSSRSMELRHGLRCAGFLHAQGCRIVRTTNEDVYWNPRRRAGDHPRQTYGLPSSWPSARTRAEGTKAAELRQILEARHPGSQVRGRTSPPMTMERPRRTPKRATNNSRYKSHNVGVPTTGSASPFSTADLIRRSAASAGSEKERNRLLYVRPNLCAQGSRVFAEQNAPHDWQEN